MSDCVQQPRGGSTKCAPCADAAATQHYLQPRSDGAAPQLRHHCCVIGGAAGAAVRCGLRDDAADEHLRRVDDRPGRLSRGKLDAAGTSKQYIHVRYIVLSVVAVDFVLACLGIPC